MSSARELGLAAEIVKAGIDRLIASGRVVRDAENRVSLAKTFYAEQYIAEKLVKLHRAEVKTLAFDDSVYGGITPHEAQRDALAVIAANPIVVLTGGPGTGKTSIVKAALAMFERNGIQAFCCAPTGKAARRMKEQTGRDAHTMHRLMREYTDLESGAPITFPAGVIIADEQSMADVMLFSRFLKHFRRGHRFLVVGDVDQLPPIGPGRTLFDIIESKVIPTTRLTKIFRQASDSSIPYIARQINEGIAPQLNQRYPDFFWVEQPDPDITAAWTVEAVATQATAQLGFSPRDVQVIAAQKSKAMGVEALNQQLQARLNPTFSQEYDVRIGGGYTARQGDRVMHAESNDYERLVFNGEIGYVVAADPRGLDEGTVTAYVPPVVSDETGLSSLGAPSGQQAKIVLIIDFEDRCVAYTRDQCSDVLLAYAITVHKAQGSQAKVIVAPIHSAHGSMLTRNLVYTAITRAEKIVIFIGEAKQLQKSVRVNRGAIRRTRLQAMLEESARTITEDEKSSLSEISPVLTVGALAFE